MLWSLKILNILLFHSPDLNTKLWKNPVICFMFPSHFSLYQIQVKSPAFVSETKTRETPKTCKLNPNHMYVCVCFLSDTLRQPQSEAGGGAALAGLGGTVHRSHHQPVWEHAPWEEVPAHHHGVVGFHIIIPIVLLLGFFCFNVSYQINGILLK